MFFALTISAVGISSTSSMGPDTNKGRDAAASIFELLDSKPILFILNHFLGYLL